MTTNERYQLYRDREFTGLSYDDKAESIWRAERVANIHTRSEVYLIDSLTGSIFWKREIPPPLKAVIVSSENCAKGILEPYDIGAYADEDTLEALDGRGVHSYDDVTGLHFLFDGKTGELISTYFHPGGYDVEYAGLYQIEYDPATDRFFRSVKHPT